MTISIALSILAFVLWFTCIEISIRVLVTGFVLYLAVLGKKDITFDLGYMSILLSTCAAALLVWF